MSIAEHERAPAPRSRVRPASPFSSETVEAGQARPRSSLDARAARPARKGRVLKLVRRVHLYLGLALLPWVQL